MKRQPVLLLLCLLLCGCAEANPVPEFTPAQTVVTAGVPEDSLPAGTETVPFSGGAVTLFPVKAPQVLGIRALGDRLLLFSGDETTKLELLDTDTMTVLAASQLGCFLDDQDPSIQIHGECLSYFDGVSKETLIMDPQLTVIRRIAAPEGLTGVPILASDHSTLYYCTENALRAWDLERDLHRTVTEMAWDTQTMTGLFRKDSLLQCTVSDNGRERVLFLSAENGQQLGCHEGPLVFTEGDAGYGAVFPNGVVQSLAFGGWDAAPFSLTPADLDAGCVYLEKHHAVVTVTSVSAQELRLEYYDLRSGQRRASLMLASTHDPVTVEETSDGSVFILMSGREDGRGTLFRWDTGKSRLADRTVYTGPLYTSDAPDTEGLARCRAYAESIGREHGLTVLIGEDAVSTPPWDYSLEAEYLVPLLERELALLEQRLSRYPEGFLAETASHFSSLTVSIVRQITGTAASGTLQTANGIQYFNGRDAYVVIAVGAFSEQALYHELFHVMDTHLLTGSSSFDRWDELNPAGFSYDYDYAANAVRDSGIYLQSESRFFVDTYSMSFPREDRARIMEYAILPGNEALFRTDAMQRKLKALCDGIREAYALTESREVLPWEQYLS